MPGRDAGLAGELLLVRRFPLAEHADPVAVARQLANVRHGGLYDKDREVKMRLRVRDLRTM